MRADRLLRMLMLLQRHRRLRAAELAERLEVSERTVLRDMEALASAGVPVWTERGPNGGCRLMDGWQTSATGLTPAEAQALFAWSARESNEQLGLGGSLASALSKVAASAPAEALDSAESLGEVVLADRRRWFAADDAVPVLPALRRASAERRRIRGAYRGAASREPSVRTLDPVGLVDHSGRWYLVAEQDGETRMFRVSRFAEVEVLDAPARLADRRPLARIWGDLRERLEQDRAATEVLLGVADGARERFLRLLRMSLVPGTDVETVRRTPGGEIWRASVRQPDAVVAMGVMFAGEVELRSPAWMRDLAVAGARRVLAAYPEAEDAVPEAPGAVSEGCGEVSS